MLSAVGFDVRSLFFDIWREATLVQVSEAIWPSFNYREFELALLS